MAAKSVISLGGPTDAKIGLSKFLNYIKNKTVPSKEVDFSVSVQKVISVARCSGQKI